MKLQTGLLLKSLWRKSAVFCVALLAAVPAWSQPQLQLPPGPGGSPNKYELEDLEIILQRTDCFGTCPVYEVRIHGNGQVVYEGSKYVRVKGRQETTIERPAVLELLKQFYYARFFEMNDGYYGQRNFGDFNGTIMVYGESEASDLPTHTVTVRIGDYEKRVVDYFGSPADLIELIELIDEVSGVRQWIRCESTPDGYCYEP